MQNDSRNTEIGSTEYTVGISVCHGSYLPACRRKKKDFVHDITYATNSQNPVEFRDLRSNDEIQKQLELGMKDLGYSYKRQREEGGMGSSVVTSSITAEATLAIWREKPHQAKFRRKEHFGKLYDEIFRHLNAAQAILAVLIFREVENERKRPAAQTPPEFLPYASHYISMLVGQELLHDRGIALKDVSHRTFPELLQRFQANKHGYHQGAIQKVSEALKQLYGDRPLSLQQLSATFRRGDLLEMLRNARSCTCSYSSCPSSSALSST